MFYFGVPPTNNSTAAFHNIKTLYYVSACYKLWICWRAKKGKIDFWSSGYACSQCCFFVIDEGNFFIIDEGKNGIIRFVTFSNMMKSFSFSHCYCFHFHCCVFHCYHRYQSSKDSFLVESLSLNLFCSRSVPSGFIWRRQCLDKVQAFVINESREMNQRQLTKASLQTAFVNISVPLLEIWKGCLVSWLCLEQTCWRNLFNQVTDKFLKS